MAKKQDNDHGDQSAPKGLKSPGTFAPVDRKPTMPGEDWPQDVPEGINSYPYPPTEFPPRGIGE